jgi:hypothetical protein
MTTSPSFDRDRDLDMTGWIGEHPVNGRDVAHLPLYPNDHGIDTEMSQVASALGLASAVDGPASVPVEQARVTIRGDIVHVLFGDHGTLVRPVQADWVQAAQDQGIVMVTCGMDPWTGSDVDDLDPYLSRTDRLFIGLLRVTHDSGQSAGRGPIVADIATLAATMPVTEEGMARKAALSAPVQAFFRDQAEPGRAYTMADIGEATGIGPEDAMPLMHCLNMLAELGILRHGQPAGGTGPTWQRPIR